ncbi:hypothetical protein BD324DRAFT_600634 [Kockovaella imperatae]|uniref:NAD-dependent epimerase/dehydratase domain-containing protein n=1 Tax=Kockovaella imperatae TaxID=4999 RepID=A0A1Y1UGB5_9TREE|nr:hypothetical protein BD324DRAFT_600634 [Kockovaella imperatae]ORX37019.1 hypothetical protein BD324DRAFT_600634 [Kockovaella imperatae]
MTVDKSLKIAVTGGAGHVGTGVVKLALAQGHSVVAIDIGPRGKLEPQARYEYKQVDVVDLQAYKAAVDGCNAIIHLAAALFKKVKREDGSMTINLEEEEQARVHNTNVAMSYNTLCIAAVLGIDRVVMASSINSIGMLYCKEPKYDFVPIDESHAFRPEDAYSVSKQICEVQADSYARKFPHMRIATLRFHFVAPMDLVDADKMHKHGGAWKDLWGWVSLDDTAEACLRGLTAPTSTFPLGHETFFIVAPTHAQQCDSLELLKTKYPDIKDVRKELIGNTGFFDCSKAERMLGWRASGFEWRP